MCLDIITQIFLDNWQWIAVFILATLIPTIYIILNYSQEHIKHLKPTLKETTIREIKYEHGKAYQEDAEIKETNVIVLYATNEYKTPININSYKITYCTTRYFSKEKFIKTKEIFSYNILTKTEEHSTKLSTKLEQGDSCKTVVKKEEIIKEIKLDKISNNKIYLRGIYIDTAEKKYPSKRLEIDINEPNSEQIKAPLH